MPKSELLVLPGLGSPESPLYQDVYGLLEAEAQRRGTAMRCLKYKGHGHLVNGSIDGEISLPGVALGISNEVEQAPTRSVLLCRSFGCLLPGYLALNHGLKLRDFDRIVFWGPVPYFHMWRLFGTDARLAEKRSEAEAKGARLAANFFQSVVPLEVSCNALLGIDVIIAVGTNDAYTDAAFAEFLATIIRKAGNSSVHVRVVENAPHEVTAAQEASVKADYLNALFSKT